MNVGSTSAAAIQGPRVYQEDRHLVLAPCCQAGGAILLAVMDGHGGDATSDRCRELLVERFEHGAHGHELEELVRVVETIGDDVRESQPGSTLSLAWILPEPDVAHWAVVGDSPLVILDADDQVFVGPDHNVRTNVRERALAESRGGRFEGGYIFNPATGSGLQMARALGDASMGEIVDCTPEYGSVGRPRSVLVASDGLADPSHVDAAPFERAVEGLRRGVAAGALLADVEARGPMDNATAVVWHAAKR